MSDQQPELLSRREVVRRALILAGAGTTVSSAALLSGCDLTAPRSTLASASAFSPADIAWLDEVAETILPATDTPGAKAAEVGAFIAIMVTDTYSPDEQSQFRDGMLELEARCQRQSGSGFMQASDANRLALLEELDRERSEQDDHYFANIKSLTVLGYFTSEIGYTQALRYIETPGRYDPCVEQKPGEPAWARHA